MRLRRASLSGVFLLVGMLTPGAAAQVPPPVDRLANCSIEGYDDHCEAWMAVEDDPDGLAPQQSPVEVVASPDGTIVYVALLESTGGSAPLARWVVAARSVATGQTLWTSRAEAPTEYTFPSGLGVSPDGSRLFVVGTRRSGYWEADSQLVLQALDASNGQTIWTSTFDGAPGGVDNARSLVVSPDGQEVYLAGISGAGGDLDYTAIGYEAATGERRWVTRYRGVGGTGSDSPFDVALTPDGDTLLMTGHSAGHGEFNVDFATVAWRTSGPEAGEIAWEARYDANDARAPDRANAIAVSPDGSTVYAGGMSSDDLDGPPFSVDYRFTILAYDVASGEQRWIARRSFEGASWAEVNDLTVSPDGSSVYATGFSNGSQNTDAILAAYDATDGAERWFVREALPEHDSERGTTVLATHQAVVMSGASSTHLSEALFFFQRRLVDHATMAFNPSNGAKLWTARLNATRIGQTSSRDAALAGNRVVVIGSDSDNYALDADTFDGVIAAYDLTGPP